jgi:hypothetical protein
MAYDLLIKNGRVVDGSGGPSFHGLEGAPALARGVLQERSVGESAGVLQPTLGPGTGLHDRIGLVVNKMATAVGRARNSAMERRKPCRSQDSVMSQLHRLPSKR